ncbi:MAG TPA: aldo/keto reductase [Candidatus Sulfotelmatobacter sp.]|nr:aldo/keto reductase [Candidatus Sulfotelmatobacter sp.]
MKYRFLGSSGLLVSRIALGTLNFGAPQWGCDEAEARAILQAFIEGGGNFIDTANVYAGGAAEDIVGRFIRDLPRERIVLASKAGMPAGKEPNAFGASRKHILAACEASLRRLQTDYLDLYYLHGPDPVAPLEETLRAYDDLVRQGKVRYVGVSNLFGWQVATATGIALRLGLAPLVAGQYIYSPIHRELEQEVIPAALAGGVGLTCYGVLGAGLLAGKYRGMAEPPKGSRMQLRMQMDGGRFWHASGHRAAQALQAVSDRTGVPMARLAVAWPLGRKFVSAVVLGISSPAQMRENLEAADWNMPPEDWKAIEAATRPAEDNLTWFNRQNYQRVFDAADFHDERLDLL